jgi:alkylation response protein AidB-like acyl-CoA dehydrogenase
VTTAIPLDDVRRMIRDSAEGLVAGLHSPRRLRALRESEAGWEREVWQAIAEAGWLALRVPEERGGAGLSLGHVATVCEVLGAALLPEPLIACGLMPTLLLADAAADTALSDALLPGVLAGDTVLALAWQEQPHQVDAAITAARLTPDSEGWRLSGSKRFVPGAVGADGLLVTARRADGALVVLHVPLAAEGVTVVPVRQVDGSVSADIAFDVVLPRDAVLISGDDAEAAMRRAVAEATVALSVTLTALAGRALAMTVDYLGKRVQFGKPIGSFQALQHRAVDLAIRVRLAEASCRDALRRCEEEGHEAAATAISAAKAIAANAALLVGREAIQLHGGMGYTDEADIGLYLKAALRLAPWLGGARQHRDVVLAATRAQRKAAQHG